jgi:hypothetical protein
LPPSSGAAYGSAASGHGYFGTQNAGCHESLAQAHDPEHAHATAADQVTPASSQPIEAWK